MNIHRVRAIRIVLCAVILLLGAVLLVAGLWPFDFLPKNQMQWDGKTGGLRSGRIGIAYTRDALRLLDSPKGSFSIEMAVQSIRSPEGGIGRILSLAGQDGKERLFIGQWKEHLILRSYGARPSGAFQEWGVDYAFVGGNPIHVVVSCQNGAVSLFVNGAPVVDGAPFTAQSLEGILILGNSPEGRQGWTGLYRGLRFSRTPTACSDASRRYRYWLKSGELAGETAADGEIARYAFNERSGRVVHNVRGPDHAIVVPENMKMMKIRVLHLPFDEFRFKKEYFLDVALNALGFIPFGFCFALFLLSFDGISGRRLLVSTAALGGFISLIIEALQALLPTRSSQLSDLVLNTASTFLGAVFCLLPLVLFTGRELQGRTPPAKAARNMDGTL